MKSTLDVLHNMFNNNNNNNNNNMFAGKKYFSTILIQRLARPMFKPVDIHSIKYVFISNTAAGWVQC
jgi:hypothetical protein